MNAQKTISDSKELFYKEFPYVIPHIYRRIADELIVELHLISHIEDFKQDDLFAAGLKKTFNDLTIGYKPIEHLEKLFNAICLSSGFDPIKIKEQSKRLKQTAKELNLEKPEQLLDQNLEINNNLKGQIARVFNENNKFHTRLISIGILDLIHQTDISKKDHEQIIEICKNMGNMIGLSEERVKKDISNYLRSIEKIEQFLELQKELNKKRKS